MFAIAWKILAVLDLQLQDVSLCRLEHLRNNFRLDYKLFRVA